MPKEIPSFVHSGHQGLGVDKQASRLLCHHSSIELGKLSESETSVPLLTEQRASQHDQQTPFWPLHFCPSRKNSTCSLFRHRSRGEAETHLSRMWESPEPPISVRSLSPPWKKKIYSIRSLFSKLCLFCRQTKLPYFDQSWLEGQDTGLGGLMERSRRLHQYARPATPAHFC